MGRGVKCPAGFEGMGVGRGVVKTKEEQLFSKQTNQKLSGILLF